MVHSIYLSEIKKLDSLLALFRKKSRVYLGSKLLFFSISAFFVYLAINRFTGFHLTGAVVFFVAYLYVCVRDNRCQQTINGWMRTKTVCQNELSYLNGDFSSFSSGEAYVNPDHAYSFDLDLFGSSSLYHRINRCVTQKGCDRLAERLANLCQNRQEILFNQEAVGELAGNFNWRIKFMANRFIPDHLHLLATFASENLGNNWFLRSIFPAVCVALTASSFLLSLFQLLGWHYFIFFFLLNIGCSILFFRRTSVACVTVGKCYHTLVAYTEVLNDVQAATFTSKVLVDLQKELFAPSANSLQAFGQLSRLLNLFNQRANAVFYFLFNGFFLFDIWLLKCILLWKKQYLSHLDRWIRCVSEMDALVSLGNYSFNHPSNTLAEILSEQDERVVEATDVYHPFLAYKQAIPNSFILRKKEVAIVTGANMAGKSTFLRTIGLNYILACNGVPVCGRVFKCSLVTLFSSMRTTDNLSKDISYFNAELLRLKQLIQHVTSHPYTLIILDEILKGTNSKDKLEGSILFLREIIRHNVAALIATHDLELARLEEEHPTVFCNYCFEIELSKDISYTYRIARGVARNLNASFLLKNILAEMKASPSILPSVH